MFKVYLVLDIVFNSLWNNLYAFGQNFIAFVNGQILKLQSDHLIFIYFGGARNPFFIFSFSS